MKNILKNAREKASLNKELSSHLIHLKEDSILEVKEPDSSQGYQLVRTDYCLYSFSGWLSIDDPSLEKTAREMFSQALIEEEENFFFVRFRGNQTRLFPHGEKAQKLWSYLEDIPFEYFSFEKKEKSNNKEFALCFPFVSSIQIRFNLNNMTLSFWRSGVTTVCSSKEEVNEFYQEYKKENQKMENFMKELKSYIESVVPTSFVNLSSNHIFLSGKSNILRLESRTIRVDYEWKVEYFFSMDSADITVIENFDEFKEMVVDYFKKMLANSIKNNDPNKDISSLYFRKFLVEVFGSTTIRTGLMENQVIRNDFKLSLINGYNTDEVHVLTKDESDLVMKHYQHEYINKVIKVVVFQEYVLILFFSGPYPFLEIYKKKHEWI